MKKIAVIGSLNMDFAVSVDEMPVKGETIMGRELNLVPGGKGANQAFALGRLGGKAVMLGAVGNDVYADMLLDNLKTAGVDVSHVEKLEDTNTGIALITVDSHGENSITVIPGANHKVDRAYIDRNADVIRESDIVIFQLEIPMDTVVYAASLAKKMGKMVILDPAPAPKELPQELLQSVDLIKPNETELARLVGMEVTEENLTEASNRLKERGVANVLVTLGGDGSFLNRADGTVHRVFCEKVAVVDTTAAGDTFTAALAMKLGEGEDEVNAMEFAGKVSSIVVTRKGAQSSIPNQEEVEEYLKRGK